MGRECDQSGNEQDAGPGNVIAANNAQTIASALCDAPNCTNTPGAGVTVYYYDGEGHRVEQIDPVTGTTVFVYDALTPMPVDDEGTTRLFTDSAGNVVERHDFDPFGHELMGTEGGWRSSVSGYGATPTSVRQQFTGQESDGTGLDFFTARYYTAAQGRFTSVDPANAGANLFDPQSWNGYSYVSNNPLSYTDPSGLGIFGDIGSIIGSFFPGLGTLIGWGIGSIADLATGQPISPPGIGIGTDIFGSIAGSVNNGQPWNEQWSIGGGGSLNTGSVFGSGDAGPFINNFADGDAWYQHAWVQDSADFVAGIGDSLSFGLSARFRKYMRGGQDTRNPCSGYYTAGEVTSLAIGARRLAYAGTAKALPVLVRGGGTALETAKDVFQARNTLKTVFRLGTFPNARMYTWAQISAKYGNDAGKIVSAATRTNTGVNTVGGIAFGGAATNLARGGCHE